jgi:membrane carboxypeptidase/penicillin-binding protein
MPVSRRSRMLHALPACLAGYLAIVACWAYVTFDDVLADVHTQSEAPLTARQTEILTSVEDPTFFSHNGISLGNGQGFATISSAVARDVYLSGANLEGTAGVLQRLYRGAFSCCKKIDLGRDVMAVVLNARLSKDSQLAIYVSHVYMGRYRNRQIRGLPQAAENYVGKKLSETTDEEFIGLVAMIKAPNQFNPIRNPIAYQARVALIRALVSGKCQADGWFDTSFKRCITS